ncbi:ribokinase [Sarracenia purpurea var. burkii]
MNLVLGGPVFFEEEEGLGADYLWYEVFFNIHILISGVPVILDAGGVDAPIPLELLNLVDILCPNESELARLTGMPTESFEQITHAVKKCHEMVGAAEGMDLNPFETRGVKQVLVKLGAKGSALFEEGEEPIRQPVLSAPRVLDTTNWSR